MASLCRTCGDKAEITTSLLDTSRHHLQWAINHLNIVLGGVLPTSVCVDCDEIIRQWTLFLSKLEKANSLFSTMTANNQCLLHQLTSDTSNTSVPSKPSTSLCSTRLSHQVSNNFLQYSPVDCISENDNSSFATPIEAIYLPDVECKFDLKDCEPFLEASSYNYLADKEPSIQIEKPSNTASLSVPGTEGLQHPQVPRQLTSHTSNTSLAAKPMFPVRSNTQTSISTNSSSSLSDQNLLQLLVKKYHIKDMTITVSRLSDQVLDSLQQNGTVDCNVVDNQMSEQRNVRIKLEPVTVDPCVYNDQVSDNLQHNVSNTVDDDDIEVPFEAIYDPVVKWEPGLVKAEPSSDSTAAQSENHRLAEYSADTVKQDGIGNSESDSDDRLDLRELGTSPETSKPSSNKNINIGASVFRCAHCKFTTNCKSKITFHIVNKHVKMSNYQCQECGKNYKYKKGLHLHISHVQLKEFRYKCLLCKRGFQLEKRFKDHIKNHNKILQCDVCGKILSSKQSLTEHKMTIHTKSSPMPCDMCSKIFYTEASLKDHTRLVHSNLSFKCDICGKSFKSKSHLREHKQGVHVSVRAFSCNQCEKAFVSKYKLKRHSVVHSDLRPFKCGKCGSCFGRSGDLSTHTRRVHSDVRAFQCHLCGQSYKSKGNLKRHLMSYSDVRNYKCEQCGKQFKTISHYNRHLTRHSEIRPFACAQCHKKFKSKTDLVRHLRFVHSDLRPFSCDKCNSCFKIKSDLSYHISKVHINVSAFKCHICGRIIKSKVNLTKHLRSHSDVRNYKCEQCGKQFKTKREVKLHLTRHSEIRPFACAQCHKKFKCKADLVQHLRQAHSDLRPFSCDKCSFACKSKFNLNKHQLVHINARKFECFQCKRKFKCRNDLSVHVKTEHSNLILTAIL